MKPEDAMETLSNIFLSALLPMIQEVRGFFGFFCVFFSLPLRASEMMTTKKLRESYDSNTLDAITITKKNSSKLLIDF